MDGGERSRWAGGDHNASAIECVAKGEWMRQWAASRAKRGEDVCALMRFGAVRYIQSRSAVVVNQRPRGAGETA